MPTYTAIAFDRLIEPGAAKSMALERRHSTPNSRQDKGTNGPSSKLERGVSVPPPNVSLDKGVNIPSTDRRNGALAVSTSVAAKKHQWSQITPALYATPVSTPLPDSPSSFPPSPYIINHKRRGPRLMKSFSEYDVETRLPVEDIKVDEDGSAAEKEELVDVVKDGAFTQREVVDPTVADNFTSAAPGDGKEKYLSGVSNDEPGTSGTSKDPAGQNGVLKSFAFDLQEDGEVDDFVDPHDSISVKSIGDSEGKTGAERPFSSTTPMAEFYDAWEDLSSENVHPHPSPDLENELREIRLSLLMEIEKRKQAEETLNNMRNQWLRIREQLSLVGLTLPVDPTTLPEGEQPADPAAEVCQQVYIARFVSNLVGRGMAKAEVEMEMEAQIKLKNVEIARLLDRLHYYKAVNQEMSQRNQEIVETARRLRQKRNRRWRWIWGSVATVIALGSAALAYSYVRGGKGSSSISAPRAPEVDHKSN